MKDVVFVFVGWFYQGGIDGGGVGDSQMVVCYFCVLFGNQVELFLVVKILHAMEGCLLRIGADFSKRFVSNLSANFVC